MTEEVFKNIYKVLQDYYDFDALDMLEFAMRYERISGETIPDDWTPKFKRNDEKRNARLRENASR